MPRLKSGGYVRQIPKPQRSGEWKTDRERHITVEDTVAYLVTLMKFFPISVVTVVDRDRKVTAMTTERLRGLGIPYEVEIP